MNQKENWVFSEYRVLFGKSTQKLLRFEKFIFQSHSSHEVKETSNVFSCVKSIGSLKAWFPTTNLYLHKFRNKFTSKSKLEIGDDGFPGKMNTMENVKACEQPVVNTPTPTPREWPSCLRNLVLCFETNIQAQHASKVCLFWCNNVKGFIFFAHRNSIKRADKFSGNAGPGCQMVMSTHSGQRINPQLQLNCVQNVSGKDKSCAFTFCVNKFWKTKTAQQELLAVRTNKA